MKGRGKGRKGRAREGKRREGRESEGRGRLAPVRKKVWLRPCNVTCF